MRSTAARRLRILEILSIRRFVTLAALESEFGVSKRTIQNDIETLSHTAPIYTVQGKGGGIHVLDGWRADYRYLSDEQEHFLISLWNCASTEKRGIIESILRSFSKSFHHYDHTETLEHLNQYCKEKNRNEF